MAVAPMATSNGKNRLKTGNINVPNPKPETKVRPAPINTVNAMRIYGK
jgi:hypothetical protein